jgi:hypothetical protein
MTFTTQYKRSDPAAGEKQAESRNDDLYNTIQTTLLRVSPRPVVTGEGVVSVLRVTRSNGCNRQSSSGETGQCVAKESTPRWPQHMTAYAKQRVHARS